MTTLGEEFPKLGGLPRRFGTEGLSLGSRLSEFPDNVRLEVENVIIKHFSKKSDYSLEVLAPGIRDLEDLPVATSLERGRVNSTLRQYEIRTWGALATWSVSGLRELSGLGDASVQDILRSLVRLLFSNRLQRSRRREASADTDVKAIGFALETLKLLATWAEREHGFSMTLMEALEHIDHLTLPPDLERRLVQVKETPLRCLTDGPLVSASVEDLTEELLQSLNEAERRVLERRVLAPARATLKEVGEEFGVTRERARQLQLSAEECITALMAYRRYLPLHWRAMGLRAAVGRCAPIDHPSLRAALEKTLRDVTEEHRGQVEGLLLHLAGPYRHLKGWLELEEVDRISADGLVELADDDGLLSVAKATSWLAEAGVESAFHDSWLAEFAKFRREGDVLLRWTGSIVDKSIAVLALRGVAADAETLVAEVGEGHIVRSAKNVFPGDERLMRVNKTEWALRKWNLEEYTGITDEIAQRISYAGGNASLTQIVDELVEKFSVRASSVRAYAEAPMFVVEKGRIRLREDDEPYPISDDLSHCRGVYKWSSDHLSVLVPVDGELLRGSGQSLFPQVAAALGVCPGRPRSFNWSEGELAITWPVTAAMGPSLGSLRMVAAFVGASDGDSIRLAFSMREGSVEAELVSESLLASISRTQALRLLTGLPPGVDCVQGLAAALDLPRSALRKCLIERGDTLVCELLPRPSSDPSLESALSELAKSLDYQR